MYEKRVHWKVGIGWGEEELWLVGGGGGVTVD